MSVCASLAASIGSGDMCGLWLVRFYGIDEAGQDPGRDVDVLPAARIYPTNTSTACRRAVPRWRRVKPWAHRSTPRALRCGPAMFRPGRLSEEGCGRGIRASREGTAAPDRSSARTDVGLSRLCTPDTPSAQYRLADGVPHLPHRGRTRCASRSTTTPFDQLTAPGDC
jgi:hypothetical protein